MFSLILLHLAFVGNLLDGGTSGTKFERGKCAINARRHEKSIPLKTKKEERKMTRLIALSVLLHVCYGLS